MNKKFNILGKEIVVGIPTYAKLTAFLIPHIVLIAVIMLVVSFMLSYNLALILLLEQGKDLTRSWNSIMFFLRLPVTFILLIWIALISAAMDEIQKKRDKERYSKPLI